MQDLKEEIVRAWYEACLKTFFLKISFSLIESFLNLMLSKNRSLKILKLFFCSENPKNMLKDLNLKSFLI